MYLLGDFWPLRRLFETAATIIISTIGKYLFCCIYYECNPVIIKVIVFHYVTRTMNEIFWNQNNFYIDCI